MATANASGDFDFDLPLVFIHKSETLLLCQHHNVDLFLIWLFFKYSWGYFWLFNCTLYDSYCLRKSH